MIEMGIAIDGGKDSLSMAANVPGKGAEADERVRCPGEFVISAYAPCEDIELTVTPDLRLKEEGALLFVNLDSTGKPGLGGSSLAQVFGALGEHVADCEAKSLIAVWNVLQTLIGQRRVFAGHDRSDGGLITTP